MDRIFSFFVVSFLPLQLLALHCDGLETSGREVVTLRQVHGVQELVGQDHRLEQLVRDDLATGQVQDPQGARVQGH